MNYHGDIAPRGPTLCLKGIASTLATQSKEDQHWAPSRYEEL